MDNKYFILLNDTLANPRIEIYFPYSTRIYTWVEALPERKFHDLQVKGKFWSIPAIPFHAGTLLASLPKLNGRKWAVDERIYTLRDQGESVAQASEKRTGRNYKDLYPFQAAGVDFLKKIGGRGIIGDEMGLGKTVQALTYIRIEKIKQTVVIAPASVLYKWKDEAKAWCPDLTAEVVQTRKEAMPLADILIMSYSIATFRYLDLEKMDIDLIIFDECHYLKGYYKKVQRVAASHRYTKGVPHIIGLSGTPFLNRPIELYNVLNMLNPSAWQSFWDFAKRYCGMNPEHGVASGINKATNTEELAERLKYIMIRRTKKEVLDQLPALSRVILPVRINMKDYRKVLKGEESSLVKLNLLRQSVGLAKVKPALEWAKNFLDTSSDKLVIYCHHHDVVGRLVSGLEGHVVAQITGKTSTKERHRIITKFQTMPKPRVLVITSAAGEGIDLFSKAKSFNSCTLLFVERDWSPLREEQVEARLHRNGQTMPVTIYYLAALSTIDEHFATLIDEKREAFTKIVGADSIETTVKNTLLKVMKGKKK